jgi:futalosine hydrolase
MHTCAGWLFNCGLLGDNCGELTSVLPTFPKPPYLAPQNMRILLVTATPFEAAWLHGQLGPGLSSLEGVQVGGHHVRHIATGIGMVNTAWALGQAFALDKPDLAINLGIAGSYAGGPELVEVVEVVADAFPELGAESPEGWLDLAAMGFAHFEMGGQPIYNTVTNPSPSTSGLRTCKGITVNTVSGISATIDARSAAWQPEVETMESAAFFQACLLAGVPFQAFRAISNRVEPRNRAAWRLKEAVEAAQQWVADWLPRLS